jgi:hypothetical protein
MGWWRREIAVSTLGPFENDIGAALSVSEDKATVK